MKLNRFLATKLFLGLALISLVLQSQAQVITLHHLGATATIQPASQAGMSDWNIQGQHELAQQWFWYAIGNTAPHSIDTIGAPTITLAGPPFLNRAAAINYTHALFGLEIDYLLTGSSVVAPGQVGHSSITETISVLNTSASPLDFHFYQYSDFNLDGALNNNTVTLSTDGSGLFNQASQTDGVNLLTESVTTANPGANRGEAELVPITRNKLNNGIAPVALNSADTTATGNVTWALEWDVLLAPGDTLLISKDKHLDVQIVPEPSALVILPLGLAAVGFYRRNRRA
jgi:hypothetical protein